MPIDEETVHRAYRLLLDREPESGQIVKALCALELSSLIEMTITSPEFLDRNKITIMRRFA